MNMLRKNRLWTTVTLVFALGIAACDAQTDSDYRGEPLAEINGMISYSGAGTPPPLDAALIWLTEEDADGEDQALGGATFPVEGMFPADFTIRLFEPPPPEAFLKSQSYEELAENTDVKIAMAGIVAAKAGVLNENFRSISFEDYLSSSFEEMIAGGVEEYGLIYLSRDVPPGRLSQELFGGETPKAGYHLMYVDEGDLDDDEFTFRETPEGLNTRVRIDISDPVSNEGV